MQDPTLMPITLNLTLGDIQKLVDVLNQQANNTNTYPVLVNIVSQTNAITQAAQAQAEAAQAQAAQVQPAEPMPDAANVNVVTDVTPKAA